MPINPFSLPPFFSALIALLLGIFILVNNRESILSLTFSLLCLTTVVWQGTWTILFNISNPQLAGFLVKLGYTGITFIPITYYHFIARFTESKTEKKYVIGAYLLGLILACFLWFSNLYANGYFSYFWGFYPRVNYLHPIYLLLLGILVVRYFMLLFSYGRQAGISPLKRVQNQYLILATLIYSISATDFIVNYGVQFYPFGFIFVILSLAIIGYAIVKAHLMDIWAIVGKAFSYSLVVGSYLLGYLGILWLLSSFKSSPLFYLLLSSIYLIFTGLTFEKIRVHLQTTADKLFIKGWYRFEDVVYKLMNALAKATTKQEAASAVIEVLSSQVEIKAVKALLRQGENGKIPKYVLLDEPKNEVPPDNSFIRYFQGGKTFTPLTDLTTEAKASMERLEFLNLLPLEVDGKVFQNKTKAFLPCYSSPSKEDVEIIFIISDKASENAYDQTDIKLFQTIIDQMSIALDRIRPYERIKNEFEANQKKLYDTDRLLARSEKIATLARLIQEYNHEIKTPLAIIKCETEALTDKPRDAAFLEKFKALVIKYIDKADDIVRTTLRLGEPKEQQQVKLNLNDVINRALKLYPPSGIHLITELNPVPDIVGDKDDLETVFVNLIRNAKEAMPDGGDLKITTYSGAEDDESMVYAEVSDKGIGIPEENLERIFEPFFSTHVTKGRGLGLSTTFRIIREHLGRIEVKSKVGFGSTFKVEFRVPKK